MASGKLYEFSLIRCNSTIPFFHAVPSCQIGSTEYTSGEKKMLSRKRKNLANRAGRCEGGVGAMKKANHRRELAFLISSKMIERT
jgi:hypothetical protein